jgi:tetratricopeptide (TPR) repeat protein
MRSSLLLLLLITFFFCAKVNSQEINWYKDYKKASEVARETGKPLLLDFTASWCKPCQAMEKAFWPRPDVVEMMQRFVCVKLNFDNETGLRSKYRISAIPNVIFTDSWGLYLLSSRGFGGSSDQLIFDKIKLLPNDFSSVKDAGNLLEDDKSNVEALNKMADFYFRRKFYFQSNDFYKRLAKLEKDPAKRQQLLIKIGLNYIVIGEYDEALDILEKFRKEFPDSAETPGVIFGQVLANVKKGKDKEALKYFAELKAAYPNSPAAAEAAKLLAQNKDQKN